MAGQKRGSKKNRRARLASFFGTQQRQPTKKQRREVESTPVAAHAFSGRLLITLALLAFMAVAAYPAISSFVKQQKEMNQVKAQISELEAEQDKLETQLSWWQDDNYVRQQAKDRLYFVTEGETPYLVVGTDYTSSLADDTSAAAKTAPQESWTNNLWNSFQESALEGYETPSAKASEETGPAQTEKAGQSTTASSSGQ